MTSTCLQHIAELWQRKPAGPDLGWFPENWLVPEIGAELQYVSSEDMNGDGFCPHWVSPVTVDFVPVPALSPPKLFRHTIPIPTI